MITADFIGDPCYDFQCFKNGTVTQLTYWISPNKKVLPEKVNLFVYMPNKYEAKQVDISFQ